MTAIRKEKTLGINEYGKLNTESPPVAEALPPSAARNPTGTFNIDAINKWHQESADVSYIEQLKSDVLAVLWAATLALSILALWGVGVALLFEVADTFAIFVGGGAALVLMFGSLYTRRMLDKDALNNAILVYTGAWLLAIFLMLIVSGSQLRGILPIALPLVVVSVTLLKTPSAGLSVALLSIVIIVVAPIVRNTNAPVDFGMPEIVSITAILAGLGLATAVNRELFTIADWALFNYQRERSMADAFFDSQNQLSRSLSRAEELGRALQDMNQELELAKNFRGQFLANMSHELRTPLNAIIGFSETMLNFPMMYDDVPLPEAYERDLNLIFNSGGQLLTVINDIIDLSKVDAGKLEIQMEPVFIRPLVDSVMATAAGLITQKPIKLTTDLPEKLPMVSADTTRLRQVLINLYSNAAKFTDEGEIRLTVHELDERTVQFTLSDTGCGIESEQLETIFEEFKQAGNVKGRDPRAGSGLGLAISRQLVTLMRGHIWAESEVGKGSKFHITLHRLPADVGIMQEA